MRLNMLIESYIITKITPCFENGKIAVAKNLESGFRQRVRKKLREPITFQDNKRMNHRRVNGGHLKTRHLYP